MTTKRKIKNPYRKGADFERLTLKFLIGDQKSAWNIGWIQRTIISGLGVPAWDGVKQRLTVFGRRTPGSKTKADLYVCVTLFASADKENSPIVGQVALGAQCKTEKPSNDEMKKGLKILRAETGLYPMWCWRQRGGKVTIFEEDAAKIQLINAVRKILYPNGGYNG